MVEGPSRYVRERDPFFAAASNDPEFCDRYKIDTWQRIDTGASGCVVRIWSIMRREYVAVKIFHDVRTETAAALADEVRVADRVVSPSVVRMFGPQQSRKLLWIEMEYVEGPTLRAFLDQLSRERKRLPLAEAAGLALAVAKGVEAIHSAGVVHRDLKPQNILLPTAGHAKAKITDFGISRFATQERATRTGEWHGTPAYSPPEWFNSSTEHGERRRVELTPAGDVYSFGMMVYEMFTSQYAYPNVDFSDPYQVVGAHLHGVPTPPSRYNPEISAELEELILRMLAKDPRERPTMSEVSEVVALIENPALARHWGPRPPASSPTPAAALPVTLPVVSPTPVPVNSERNAKTWGAGLAGLGVAATLLVVALTLRGPQGPSAPAIDARLAVATPVSTATPTATASSVPTSVASPRASAPPAASAAIPAPVFDLKMDPDGVILRNDSNATVRGIEMTLRAAGGAQYRATSPDALASRTVLMMPLSLFDPPPPEGARFQQLDVLIRRTSAGRQALSLPLQP